jgi:CelD/BcsL family acetyltransferase involved in cellulose biosynthesis
MIASVRALSLAELDDASPAFDAAVAASPDIDRFCSSSDWALPAARALMPAREPFVVTVGSGVEQGFVALMAARHTFGPTSVVVLEPLEAMWALGCPLVGAHPDALARELCAACAEAHPRALLLLSGLAPGSARLAATARALEPRYQLHLGPIARRHVADLRGGVDAFLSRRTPNLRRNLQRARKRAREERITFVAVEVAPDQAERAYERLLAVERRSWKAAQGVSILDSELEGFYRLMLPRLARRGAVRLMFAQKGGADVAYILGGVLGDRYRGLQFSYARDLEALSLGNLCQLHQVEALCDEGIVSYDLGAEVEYKRRWGEEVHETISLLAVPRT